MTFGSFQFAGTMQSLTMVSSIFLFLIPFARAESTIVSLFYDILSQPLYGSIVGIVRITRGLEVVVDPNRATMSPATTYNASLMAKCRVLLRQHLFLLLRDRVQCPML